MVDRLSVLARGGRAVLCITAKSDPLRSEMGQTLPSHSALVRINVSCSPQATESRTSREWRKGPKAEVRVVTLLVSARVDFRDKTARELHHGRSATINVVGRNHNDRSGCFSLHEGVG
jgi:hypothetical protein